MRRPAVSGGKSVFGWIVGSGVSNQIDVPLQGSDPSMKSTSATRLQLAPSTAVLIKKNLGLVWLPTLG